MKKLLILPAIALCALLLAPCSFSQTTTSGGTYKHSNTGTTASHAVTMDNTSGVITTEALTTAGLATETITVTDAKANVGSIIFCTVENGTNTQGTTVVGPITPGAGSFTVGIRNVHATQPLNGTLKLRFWFAP